jgi:hypothetical protein
MAPPTHTCVHPLYFIDRCMRGDRRPCFPRTTLHHSGCGGLHKYEVATLEARSAQDAARAAADFLLASSSYRWVWPQCWRSMATTLQCAALVSASQWGGSAAERAAAGERSVLHLQEVAGSIPWRRPHGSGCFSAPGPVFTEPHPPTGSPAHTWLFFTLQCIVPWRLHDFNLGRARLTVKGGTCGR